MKWIDLLHRWMGGVMGLLLALLGFTGAILVHRDAWIMLPHAGDAQVQETRLLGEITAKVMADPATRPNSLTFASQNFGLHRLSYENDGGAYVDQSGNLITAWGNQWERPELWLFDLHHHLFAGDTGETVIGVAAVAGLLFVITGVVMWWRTRKTFEFRVLPARMTRPALVRHHRDLGIVVAPLLLISLLTGAILVFRPMASLILGPGAAGQIDRALAAPNPLPVALADNLDWKAMIVVARTRFPDAEVRSIALPRKNNGLITLRMRGLDEWLPNGRTTVWFAADTGKMVAARDASKLRATVRVYNALYPLHAAKIGGLAYRIVMTIAGLAMGMLGTLAVWTFWFKAPRNARR